ncbi:HtaA domain-containing protein [Canibacter sp. lx-45]|uniref:HtaA domain-containing protein n=1 Tax=Canibacter zhuwentaonis TaxID=2837491 RepID=UPI001BDC1229|nr:HtaA domain-containing protein [Canibacter zhuwentaonis]MBT1035401.1 HtaA domain-containing protein [Canibacter zhuwentaonis]
MKSRNKFVGAALALLVGAGSFALAPTVANAEPGNTTNYVIDDGAFSWGFRDSFRSYVTNPALAKGTITPVGGVTADTDITAPGKTFHWTNGKGKYSYGANPSGSIAFSGGVHFKAHEGLLDLTFSNPVVKFTSKTEGVLLLDLKGLKFKSFTEKGEIFDVKAVEFAKFKVTKMPSIDRGKLTISASDVTITEAGRTFTGSFYQPNTKLDPLKVSFTLKKAADSVDQPADSTAPPATHTHPKTSATVNGKSEDVQIVAGKEVELKASGFDPYETVEIWVNSTPVHITTTRANLDGDVSYLWTVPEDFELGLHTFNFKGTKNSTSIKATVIAPESAKPVPADTAASVAKKSTGAKKELASTGAADSVLPMGIATLSALVGAAALVVASRRKQNA